MTYLVLGTIAIGVIIYLAFKLHFMNKEHCMVKEGLKELDERMLAAFDKNTVVLNEVKAMMHTMGKHV